MTDSTARMRVSTLSVRLSLHLGSFERVLHGRRRVCRGSHSGMVGPSLLARVPTDRVACPVTVAPLRVSLCLSYQQSTCVVYRSRDVLVDLILGWWTRVESMTDARRSFVLSASSTLPSNTPSEVRSACMHLERQFE